MRAERSATNNGRELLSEPADSSIRLVSNPAVPRRELAEVATAEQVVAPERDRSQFRAISGWLAVTDALCLITALLLAYFIRFGLTPMPLDYQALVFVAPLVWIGVFQAFSLYHPQHLGPEEEFRRVISAVSIGIVFLVMASFWSYSAFSRTWIGLTWAFVLVLELIFRRMWRAYIAEQKAAGGLSLRTLIVGPGEQALRVAGGLTDPSLGLRPVGYVADGDIAVSFEKLPFLGKIDELADSIRASGAECVFVSSGAVEEENIARVVTAARRTGAEVRVASPLPELLTSRLSVQPIAGTMTMTLRPPKLTRLQLFVKRVFDVVVSAVALVLVSPVMVVVALAVGLTSRGGVLFSQERVTKGGKLFKMLKFRTMRRDADAMLAERNIDPTKPFFKLGADDPRLTRVGKWIRRWSLDELPQLFNVLRGDMSLVGPRPLPADQVAANLELLGTRHEVPAGITGWWQIRGRSMLDSEDAVKKDLFYIENWSLTLDIYILLRTIGVILARKGAY